MDEEKRKKDYEEYVGSFAEAMKEVEAEYKRKKRFGPCYKELKREGMWTPEVIANHYVLVAGKMSPLSRRLREYITQLGALAYRKHKAKHPDGEKKQGDTESVPHNNQKD